VVYISCDVCTRQQGEKIAWTFGLEKTSRKRLPGQGRKDYVYRREKIGRTMIIRGTRQEQRKKSEKSLLHFWYILGFKIGTFFL
jgi:hypothetical protein